MFNYNTLTDTSAVTQVAAHSSLDVAVASWPSACPPPPDTVPTQHTPGMAGALLRSLGLLWAEGWPIWGPLGLQGTRLSRWGADVQDPFAASASAGPAHIPLAKPGPMGAGGGEEELVQGWEGSRKGANSPACPRPGCGPVRHSHRCRRNSARCADTSLSVFSSFKSLSLPLIRMSPSVHGVRGTDTLLSTDSFLEGNVHIKP